MASGAILLMQSAYSLQASIQLASGPPRGGQLPPAGSSDRAGWWRERMPVAFVSYERMPVAFVSYGGVLEMTPGR